MASISLQVSQIFAVAETVGAYQLAGYPGPVPPIPPVTTAAVDSNGILTFTGLTASSEYIAYSTSSGRRVEFLVNPDPVTFASSVDLTTEITNRQNADTGLQTQINAKPSLSPSTGDTGKAIDAHTGSPLPVTNPAVLPVNAVTEGALPGLPNCSTQLVAAAAKAVSQNQSLYLPGSTLPYNFDDYLMPSGLLMYGDGEATILKVASAAQSHPLRAAAGSDKITLLRFAFDGNKSALVGNPDVVGNPNQSIWFDGTDASPCTNIVVQEVSIRNCKRLGLGFANVQGGAIRNCVVEDNDRDGVTLYYSCQDINIVGNRIKRCGDDHIGINAEDGVTTGHALKRIRVFGNTIVGGSARNKGKGITVRGGEQISIVDNTIDGVSESGIQLGDYNTTWLREVVVGLNRINAAGTNGTAGKNGILVYANDPNNHAGGTYAGIDGVTITANRVKACLGVGINVNSGHATAGECLNIEISDNSVRGCTAEGIYVSDQAITDVVIERNRVIGNGARGIRVDGVTLKRIFVEHNRCADNVGEGVYIFGVTDGSEVDNRCWDTRSAGARTQTVGVRMSTVSGTWRRGTSSAWNNSTAQFSDTSVPSASFTYSVYNALPQSKQSIAAAATDAATTQTLANDLRTKLTTYGLF